MPQHYDNSTDEDETRNLRSLRQAVQSSYKSMESFRNLNRKLITEYAGPGYGSSQNVRREKYLNKMNQAVDAYTMMLVANSPRVDITTRKHELSSFARLFTSTFNEFIREIGIDHTLRRWVLDAIFCVGCIKCHLADSYEVQLENDLWMDPGIPFASNISLDNLVVDMHAPRTSEMKFCGDMYRISFRQLQEGAEIGMFDPSVVSNLVPTSKYNTSDDRLEYISNGAETDVDEIEPMIDLADVWVKDENKIYTFPVSDRNQFIIKSAPLAEMEWGEVEHSPYHFLGFNEVPENIMPVSPAAHLISLEQLINNILRKQARRAQRQKSMFTYSPGEADAARRIKKAGDGDLIQVNDPREHGILDMPGVDGALQSFLLSTLQQLDDQAGNLTAMLGLGPQARTVGQEQIIASAGNRKIGAMQQKVVDGTKSVLRTLGLMLWEDEFKEVVTQVPLQGAEEYKVTMEWRPGEREGNFLDYNFDINVYSMTYRPPAQQVETINMLMSQVIFPGMEMLMQQGGQVNFQALVEMYAEMLDIPKLRDLIQFSGGPPTNQEPIKAGLRKSAVSTRNYVRSNVPTGGSQQAKSLQEQQSWMRNGETQNTPGYSEAVS